MPHGTPDWGLIGPKETVYGLDDLAEQAVRLGSHHLWDRRGDVILLDSFENGLGNWATWCFGLNSLVTLMCGHAAHGAYSVLTRSGVGAGSGWVYLYWYHGQPRFSRMGLEFAFSMADYMTYWEWEIFWYTGVQRMYARIRWDLASDLLECRDSTPAWRTFGTGVCHWNGDFPVHVGKMVADFAASRYVRFILNETTYPLVGIGLDVGPDPSPPYMEVRISMAASEDEIVSGYVDNVVVTQNEP